MSTELLSKELDNPALDKNVVSGVGFISDPKTVEEFEHNVQFQFDNVSGWMSVKNYECALIKAMSLVDALKELVQQKH